MNYVDWVEHVARAVASRTASSGWIVRPSDILGTTDAANEAILAAATFIEEALE